MSIADRIQAINDHLIDDYKVLRLAGADLTGVNKNIVNLKPTWEERLLYFMNNGTQEVWNNWDKVNGSGTSLSLNNTEEAPMSLTYKGDTLQNGTPTPSTPITVQTVSGDNSIEVVGKNLLPNNVVSQTLNSLTITKNSDDSITINGTASTTTELRINTNNFVLQSGTYYISTNKSGTFGNNAYINVRDADTSTNLASVNIKNASGVSFTLTEAKNVYVRFYVSSGISLTNVNVLLQLEKGNQATTYEPYQGASYPISLGVENLISVDNIKSGSYSSSNGNYVAYGSRICTNDKIKVQPNTKYIVSNNNTSSYNITNIVDGYTSDKTFISRISNANGNGNPFVFTTPSNCEYINLTFSNTSDQMNWNVFQEYISNGIISLQLEKGETLQYISDTPIELCKIGTYQDKIDKSTGKNLTTITSFSTINGGYINSSNGKIAIVEQGKKYALSFMNNTSYTNGLDVRILTDSSYESQVYAGIVANSRNVYTFTATTNGMLYLSIKVAQDTTNIFTEIMLNEGTTALPYEPYGTSWYLKKEICKVVLDGTESYVFPNGSFNAKINGNYISDAQTISNQTVASIKCNILSAKSLDDVNANHLMGIAVSTDRYIRLKLDNSGTDQTMWTVSTVNDYLQNNSVIIYYPLATPTYETITDTTLISQLEEAKKSYESQTNISQVNNDLPFELDVVALGVM